MFTLVYGGNYHGWPIRAMVTQWVPGNRRLPPKWPPPLALTPSPIVPRVICLFYKSTGGERDFQNNYPALDCVVNWVWRGSASTPRKRALSPPMFIFSGQMTLYKSFAKYLFDHRDSGCRKCVFLHNFIQVFLSTFSLSSGFVLCHICNIIRKTNWSLRRHIDFHHRISLEFWLKSFNFQCFKRFCSSCCWAALKAVRETKNELFLNFSHEVGHCAQAGSAKKSVLRDCWDTNLT